MDVVSGIGPSTGFVDVTSVWHVLGTGVANALLIGTRVAGKDDALDLGSYSPSPSSSASWLSVPTSS